MCAIIMMVMGLALCFIWFLPITAVNAQSGAAAPPHIANVPAIVVAGGSFTIAGNGFTPGSVVNFFVATSSGPVNNGPLTPSAQKRPR